MRISASHSKQKGPSVQDVRPAAQALGPDNNSRQDLVDEFKGVLDKFAARGASSESAEATFAEALEIGAAVQINPVVALPISELKPIEQKVDAPVNKIEKSNDTQTTTDLGQQNKPTTEDSNQAAMQKQQVQSSTHYEEVGDQQVTQHVKPAVQSDNIHIKAEASEVVEGAEGLAEKVISEQIASPAKTVKTEKAEPQSEQQNLDAALANKTKVTPEQVTAKQQSSSNEQNQVAQSSQVIDPNTQETSNPGNLKNELANHVQKLVDGNAKSNENNSQIKNNTNVQRVTAEVLALKIALEGIKVAATPNKNLEKAIEETHKVDKAVSAIQQNNTKSSQSNDGALLRESRLSKQSDKNPRPVRTLNYSQSTRTLEKVENALREAARSRDGKTISIKLEQSELGKVKADVTLRDGSLHARLIADSPAVYQLLKDKAPELQGTLRKLGLNVDQITIAVGGSENNEFSLGTSSGQQQQSQQEQALPGFGHAAVTNNAFTTRGTLTKEVVDDHWVA